MTVQSDFQANVSAKIQAQASATGSAGAQWLQQNTGIDVNNQRTGKGAAAAASLFANGFDPTNPSDRDKLVEAISGAMCLAGPAGCAMGAATESLYQLAQPMACPTFKVLHDLGLVQSDCDSPPCVVNGPPPTLQSVLQASQLPSYVPGSFQEFVFASLAQNAAAVGNCRSGIPAEVIVDAAVAMWNSLHQGPAVDLYVPPLIPVVPLIPTWSSVQNQTTGSVDPNVYYAFAPISSTYFQTIANAPSPPPTLSGIPAVSILFSTGGWPYPIPSAARTISVNSGKLLASTGSSVAKKAGVVVAGGAAGALIYAWVAGKAIDKVFGGLFGTLGTWAQGAIKAVDGGIAVRETRRRRR